MEYDSEGLARAREAAEDSNFPGRHAGCAIHAMNDEGKERWFVATNQIACCEASDLDKQFGVHDMEKPYDWTPHAEIAAIVGAASSNVNLFGATAYLAGSPCLPCSIAMAHAGIDLVVIANDDAFKKTEWGIKEGLAYLQDYGVNVVREA